MQEITEEAKVKDSNLQEINLRDGWKLGLTWVDRNKFEREYYITQKQLDTAFEQIKGYILAWGIPQVGYNLMFGDDQSVIEELWIDCVDKKITLFLD